MLAEVGAARRISTSLLSIEKKEREIIVITNVKSPNKRHAVIKAANKGKISLKRYRAKDVRYVLGHNWTVEFVEEVKA